MNYILEGANCTGKTTYINKLKEKEAKDFDYLHLDSKTKNDYEYHKELMQRDNYVYDRFFIGEIIYSIIFNRQPKITLSQIEHLLKKYQHNKLIILYCDKKTLTDRLTNRKRNGDEKILKNYDKQVLLANDLFFSIGKYLSKKYSNVELLKN